MSGGKRALVEIEDDDDVDDEQGQRGPHLWTEVRPLGDGNDNEGEEHDEDEDGDEDEGEVEGEGEIEGEGEVEGEDEDEDDNEDEDEQQNHQFERVRSVDAYLDPLNDGDDDDDDDDEDSADGWPVGNAGGQVHKSATLFQRERAFDRSRFMISTSSSPAFVFTLGLSDRLST